MINADYIEDLVLFANTPAQSKSQQHNLEQASRDIGLHVNSDKPEFLCFKQEGAIFTLSGKSLKIDQFTYLSSHILSTESNVNNATIKTKQKKPIAFLYKTSE